MRRTPMLQTGHGFRPSARIPDDVLVDQNAAPTPVRPPAIALDTVAGSADPSERPTAVTPARCPACGVSKVDFAQGELAAMGEHAEDAREQVLGPIARGEPAARPMAQPRDAADHVARLVASWAFPITVLLLIVVWVTVNLAARTFEPFPTVMLAVISAVLASLGALQGPIILRVQRRQRQRDRERDEIDHRINLRAEVEIRWLDHKLTHLLEGLEVTHGQRPTSEQHTTPERDAPVQQRPEPPDHADPAGGTYER